MTRPTITKHVQELIQEATGLAEEGYKEMAEVRAAALEDAGFDKAAREIRLIAMKKNRGPE